ncbi:Ulp1 protease family, C-terminal catalytic domain containing protein [Parasponia andersonii]|uniref:Ulp1 protease family, C-terminal catalytic domain containing protein n=1 Tax=Parasponia andersonii TaxID=3476 RepID=A0A2P5AFI5_PARAD|nr:Ulp1 protease family, C-terminal catalytic domain containing protein [Parasponia andersonii]
MSRGHVTFPSFFSHPFPSSLPAAASALPSFSPFFLVNKEFNDINRYQTGKNKSSQPQPPQTQEKVHPQRNKAESVTQTQFKFVDGAPASIKLQLNTIQGVDEVVVVNVPFDEEVFGEAFCLPVFKEDIIEFCIQQKIRAMPITLYMRYLHHLVTQYGYQARYMFMDPSAVATKGGPREDRAISLVTRMLSMENEHQFLITPWNHGDHWILLIIYPLKDYAWALDPLGLALREEIDLTMIERLGRHLLRRFISAVNRPSTAPYKCLCSQVLSRHLEPRRFCGRRERPFKALIRRLEKNFLLQ